MCAFLKSPLQVIEKALQLTLEPKVFYNALILAENFIVFSPFYLGERNPSVVNPVASMTQ